MSASSPDEPISGDPLTLEHLTVHYGTHVALSDLSLTVREGEIYGLLGSNGAGKSTTIKTVVGLVPRTAGIVQVFGVDPLKVPLEAKRRIGYVAESPLLLDSLTPSEFLQFIASVRKIPAPLASERAGAYAQAFQLTDEMHRPIATLSNGTKQKVMILAAMLHQPPLLVLDEPLNSLDPRSVRIVKELLARYVRSGRRGVLFSTHTMEIAEKLCDRIGILDRGVLRGEGTMTSLRGQVEQGHATLEEIFLRLTQEEEGIQTAIRALNEAGG